MHCSIWYRYTDWISHSVYVPKYFWVCNFIHRSISINTIWTSNIVRWYIVYFIIIENISNCLNPQMPKVKIHLRTPKGGVGTTPPWILVFPSEFFKNISHGYVFGVKESNGDNEKILSLLHDLENQGQTPFYLTFHISGCKHDTKLILVSILTFSRSRISKMLKTIPWPWRLTLEFKVTHIHCMTFINSGCIHDADLILVSILTFSKSRISENSKSITWPWFLTLKI